MKRRKTRTLNIGGVKVGSGHPVSIQSMVKTATSDVRATVEQVRRLEEAGCEIVRVAVRDQDDAAAISDIRKEISIPLVADIHFDWRLAREAAKRGADKIRVNPGNIYRPEDVDNVIDAAAAAGIPVRIGVNSGSLRTGGQKGDDLSRAMSDAALEYAGHFRKRGFGDIVISLKASEVPATVRAYEYISGECDYPLHLGITAAGLPRQGMISSSAGIGALLLEGIGDTVRVSLTGDPVEEVRTARDILSAVGARYPGPRIISCPTCGRCRVDLVSIAEELERRLDALCPAVPGAERKDMLIAVMGCEVNGPGEAKEADVGIAFGQGKGAIFAHGEVVKTVEADKALEELLAVIREEL